MPNGWNRPNTFDSWHSYLSMDGMNRWTDLCQIHTEDVFGPSLRRVGMSRSKVKGQSYQGQKLVSWSLTSLFSTNMAISETKTRDKKFAFTTPAQYGRNGMASLQITLDKQQAHRFYCWWGVSTPACIVRAVGLAGYCLALPRISSYYYYYNCIPVQLL